MTQPKQSATKPRASRRTREFGFSLIELLIVCAVLAVVTGAIMKCIDVSLQRSRSEQVKVDLTQEGRQFVDEFERDIHQAGYPSCRMSDQYSATCIPGSIATAGSSPMTQSTVAMGLVYVSNYEVVFEGDVNGDGIVESVWYRLIDSDGNYPPTTTCPCTLQRSEEAKNTNNSTFPLSQATVFSQELDNIINSGVPTGTNVYGNGLNISGNVLFGNQSISNTAYYAAVVTMKDYPLFSAYDQYGNLVALPRSIMTQTDQPFLMENMLTPNQNVIKSIRLTINLLGSGTSGYDQGTKVRPVQTLVGSGRINNNF